MCTTDWDDGCVFCQPLSWGTIKMCHEKKQSFFPMLKNPNVIIGRKKLWKSYHTEQMAYWSRNQVWITHKHLRSEPLFCYWLWRKENLCWINKSICVCWWALVTHTHTHDKKQDKEKLVYHCHLNYGSVCMVNYSTSTCMFPRLLFKIEKL